MTPALTTAGLDLLTLADLYQAKEVRPRDVITLVRERGVAHPDPAVWIHLASEDELLAEADAGERRLARTRPPLYGVPFAVKDNIDVAGRPTTAACPAYGRVAAETA